MKDLQIFRNEELNIDVRAAQNMDGSISINAEDAAIGFGWYKTEVKNGKEYKSIRWERMSSFTKEYGFDHKWSKDDYIPESLFYLLGMKANNKVAQEFQKWLAIKVIPSIRKTGSYSVASSQLIVSEMVAQLETLVNDKVTKKINEIEEKCSKLYRPACVEKTRIVSYIKNMLGISKANRDYELVKQRILLKLKADKWEDIPVELLIDSIDIIDESIRVVTVMKNSKVQTRLF